jgi:hypothetical protein
MQALAVNLGIIFGSRLITKNFLNLFLPYLKTYRRRRLEEKFAGSRPLSPAEQEFIKEPFDMIADSLRQFADVSTFFGYTVYFTSALPAAPFFAWLNTYLGNITLVLILIIQALHCYHLKTYPDRLG